MVRWQGIEIGDSKSLSCLCDKSDSGQMLFCELGKIVMTVHMTGADQAPVLDGVKTSPTGYVAARELFNRSEEEIYQSREIHSCGSIEFSRSEITDYKINEELSARIRTQLQKTINDLYQLYSIKGAKELTVYFPRVAASDSFCWVALEIDGRVDAVLEYRISPSGVAAPAEWVYDQGHRNLPPAAGVLVREADHWLEIETIQR